MTTKTIPYRTSCKVKQDLRDVSNRLKGVQIESLHYAELLERYEATAPQQLFYFDPPYTSDERVAKDVYNTEWGDGEHVDAAKILRGSNAYVVVSGYKSQLYKELYEDYGWQRKDKLSQTNGKTKTESIWLNPAITESNGQIRLF